MAASAPSGSSWQHDTPPFAGRADTGGQQQQQPSRKKLEKVGRVLRAFFSATSIPTVYEIAGERRIDGATLTGEAEQQRLRQEKGKARVVVEEEDSSDAASTASSTATTQSRMASFRALMQKVSMPTYADAVESSLAPPSPKQQPACSRQWSPAGTLLELSSMSSMATSSSFYGDDSPGPSSRQPSMATMV